MKRLTIIVVAVVAAVVAMTVTAVGIVLANRGDPTVPMSPAMMVPGSSSSPGWWDDSWGSMTGMMGNATVTSEREYLVDMVAHHKEAVAAARQLTRSNRPELRSLAESIINTQSSQIDEMTGWLARWYPDQSPSTDYQPMMRDLADRSGDRLDRVFLQDMIGHHMVAVMMSQQLLWRGTEHEEVAQLARSIRDGQHAEIIQMQNWLARWYQADWRYGMGWGQGSGWGMGPGMMWGSSR